MSLIDPDTLAHLTEDMRCRVASMREHPGGRPLSPVTISIGFALYPQHGDSLDQVLGAADAALYRAEQSGRNRVEPAG